MQHEKQCYRALQKDQNNHKNPCAKQNSITTLTRTSKANQNPPQTSKLALKNLFCTGSTANLPRKGPQKKAKFVEIEERTQRRIKRQKHARRRPGAQNRLGPKATQTQLGNTPKPKLAKENSKFKMLCMLCDGQGIFLSFWPK